MSSTHLLCSALWLLRAQTLFNDFHSIVCSQVLGFCLHVQVFLVVLFSDLSLFRRRLSSCWNCIISLVISSCRMCITPVFTPFGILALSCNNLSAYRRHLLMVPSWYSRIACPLAHRVAWLISKVSPSHQKTCAFTTRYDQHISTTSPLRSDAQFTLWGSLAFCMEEHRPYSSNMSFNEHGCNS